MAVPWTTSPGFSPEVGVCSFARFSREFLQVQSSVPDPALSEAAAAGGPETLPHEGGRTLCFSALGMVQCCKVSMGVSEAPCTVSAKRKVLPNFKE